MKSTNRWSGPVLLIAVLIVTSFVTIGLPRLVSSMAGGGSDVQRPEAIEIPQKAAEMEVVRFDVDGYIVGEELIKIPALADVNDREVNSIPLLLALVGIFTVLTFLVAGPIALFVMIGQRQTSTLAADDGYKEAVSSMDSTRKDAESLKNKSQPKTGKPESHNRPQVAAWATGGMIVFMAYMFGYTLGEGIWIGSGGSMANLFSITAIILSWYFFRPQQISKIESEGTTEKVNYGPTVWVALSGAIMMGLGVGFMFAVMSGSDPLPFITWTPGPGINWEYLNELVAPLLT